MPLTWSGLVGPGWLVLLAAAGSARAQPDQQEGELQPRVEQIFENRCARSGCHIGPVAEMGMDLEPSSFFSAVVDQASRQRPALQRVAPGRPGQSYLLMKVKGAPEIEGDRMPPFGGPLPEEDIAAIERWIAALSPGGPPAAPVAAAPAMPFPGWKVVNLPTTRALSAGQWLLLIGHRFHPALDTGYDTFFGLDGAAIIHLSLGFAFTDSLLVSLGRSNAADTVELSARQILLRRRPGALPLEAAVQGAVDWRTEAAADQGRFSAGRFSPALQLSLTSELAGGRLALAFVPGVLFNPPATEEDRAALLALGLGARARLSERLALVGEWVPVPFGFARSRILGEQLRFDSWAAGIEILTSGHVFQVVAGNSLGMTASQYLRGGDLDIASADVRLGFNIFRALELW